MVKKADLPEGKKNMDPLAASIVNAVSKKYGDGVVFMADEADAPYKISAFIPTGNIVLDKICGGGIPVGRITEIYGDFSTGKSALAYKILANTQKMGGVAILFDTEMAYDAEWAERVFGLDPHNLIPMMVDTIEEFAELVSFTIEDAKAKRDGRIITIVLDSVAATSFKTEMDGTRASEMGKRGGLWSEWLRKNSRMIAKEKVALVFINQIRDKMNVMYGAKTDTPGGHAIKFHSSIRLKMKNVEDIKDEKTKEVIGARIELFTEKNKIAPPSKTATFVLDFEKGIGLYDGLLDYLCNRGVIQQAGGWYNYGTKKKFRSSDFEEVLKEFPELLDLTQKATESELKNEEPTS